MITVWGRRNSVNVQKVMWTLGELDMAYQRHDVAGSFGVDKAYLQLNPNGVVPTITDGDLVLYESNACVRHLARTRGAGTLMPSETDAMARVDQWMDWQCCSFGPAFFLIFLNQIRLPADKSSADQLQKGVQQTGRLLSQLDPLMQQQPYLIGEQFTAADIPLGAMLYRYFEMDIERPPLPGIESYYARLASRTAYQQHVMIAFGRNSDEWLVAEQANAGIQ